MKDEATGKKTIWRIDVASEEETRALAREIASLIKSDDVITLAGDLGAGKTTFARALIRTLLNDETLEAPSPTFSLMQCYEGNGRRIVHADFYRLEGAADLMALGWEEAIDGAIVIAEWADKAREVLPADRLSVRLSFADVENREARRLTISGFGAFAARLAIFKNARELLLRSGWSDAARAFLMGDASSRAYETLTKPDGSRAILMISPPRPDGPPIRYGKSYSAIARLAENVTPFVALANALRERGFSAPEIYAQDLDAGLLIIEDLGREGVVDERGPISERYIEAAAALAHLHNLALPESLRVGESGHYDIPPYDLDALLIEIELLPEWYVAHKKASINSGARATFVNLWRQALLGVAAAEPTWTLRDYHSPNLLWLPAREGIKRVGIIDFQDCVLGHPAYDLASLGQDARVTVTDELEFKLLAVYIKSRRECVPDFDMALFIKAYSILAAQRATKVLGIFARLDQRDGKPQYLAHMPRVEAYLRKSLRHPSLVELQAWYETNLPALYAGVE